jgi:hypothetical protein
MREFVLLFPAAALRGVYGWIGRGLLAPLVVVVTLPLLVEMVVEIGQGS